MSHAVMALQVNKMLSYRRETALQGALQFLPKVEECMGEGDNILRTYLQPLWYNQPQNLSNSVKKNR